MERRFIGSRWALPLLLLAVHPDCHAQTASSLWNMVKNKVEQKIGQKVENGVDPVAGDGAQASASGAARRKSIVNAPFDFVVGDVILFHDDFNTAPLGSMPKTWKTDGSGRVATLQGFDGKWLELQAYAIYKLAKPVELPAKFTVEFDVVAATDRVEDLSILKFGLAKDNGVSDQETHAINEVGLHYMNGAGGGVHSEATDYHHTFDFDLTGYANRILHVSMTVDGYNMAVYLDKTKIADTRLFNNNPAKYFYLSAPSEGANGAKAVIGNFRVAGFK